MADAAALFFLDGLEAAFDVDEARRVQDVVGPSLDFF